jgi:uncharacterized delta-60 repeat protein
MKATAVMNAGTLKYCTKKKESSKVEKHIKDLNQLGTSTKYISKNEIYGGIEKLKIKYSTKYFSFFLLSLFLLSQNTEAQTGKLDPTFNTGGLGVTSGSVLTTQIQTDGKIILGGSFLTYNTTSTLTNIVRVTTTGTLDATFNSGFDNTVNKILIQPDGNIIVVGNFNKCNGSVRKGIARISAAGTMESNSTFNPGNGPNNTVYDAALQSDGKIIIAGGHTKYGTTFINRINRVNTNGTFDATFNPPSAADNTIYTIAIQTDQNIIAGGAFTTFNGVSKIGLVRITPTGTVDATFNTGTGVTSSPTNSATAVRACKIQSDGKILIGGFFSAYRGTASKNIARLNSNGSIDAAFIIGTGPNNTVNTINLQADGKIIIAGEFTSYNGTPCNHIARLNVNGSIDNTFKPTSGANNTIYTTSFQTDNKLIIGGIFTNYDGVATGRFARLLMACSTVTASASQNNVTCNGLSNGSATVSASGGFNFTYSWTPIGGTSNVASSLTAGNYTCVATNDCLNFASATFTISQPSSITLTTGSIRTICGGNTASLFANAVGGTGTISYNWMPGNLFGGSQTVTPNTNTIYTVTATDSIGCMKINTQTVIVPWICPVSSVPCGKSYSNFNNYSTCQLISGATNYRFRFYDNSNNMVAEKTQPSNYIYYYTVGGLKYNTIYKWTVSVDKGLGFGPESNNSCNITFNAPKTIVPCGNSYSNFNTYTTCQIVNGATNYRFRFYNNNDSLVAEKTQPSNYIYFNTVGGLKYNTIYKWTVEVEYNNPISGIIFGPASSNSCTITFNAPKTIVPCGNSYSNINSYTTCQIVNGVTNYRFRFYDNNDSLVAEKIQPSNYIYFKTVSGLNYNKTYKWTVEVEFNDPVLGLIYGPPSSNLCTLTFNAPQTAVPCGLTYAINGYSGLAPIFGAVGYRWTFYDANTNAFVASKTNPTQYIYFNTVAGLTFNKAYKWTVEVQYYNGVSNVFGPPSSNSCTMNYGTPSAIIANESTTQNAVARSSEKSNIIYDDQILINLFPNPTKDKLFVESSEEVQSVKIYNIVGALVLTTKSASEINLSDLELGLYFVEIETENTTKHFEVIKE